MTSSPALAPRHRSRFGRVASGLSPELLHAARKRLGAAALIYAVTHVVVQIVYQVANALEPIEGNPWGFYNLLTAAGVSTALVVFGITRWKRASAGMVLTVALLFQIVGSFIISFTELWQRVLLGFPEGDAFVRISWVCLWILVFPVLVPTNPVKMFVASLISAATGGMVLAIGQALGHPMPDLSYRIILLAPNFICAVIAYLTARIIYGLSREVTQAQEMGNYRLVEKLGEGGMGEVWRAQHRLLARPAAIKLIRPDAIDSVPGGREVLMARFEREAQATAGLRSPHTVSLYDFGVAEDGSFYYVMELLEGLDLEEMVQRYGPLPAERVASFLRQTCRSLAEAHAAGLVHRDIKPSNLVASRVGIEADFVKVLDFGLVKRETAVAEAEGDAQLTLTQTTSGTPAYMAPEIAMGDAPVDGRADLYALGCVGYWLLTGDLVFTGRTPMQVVLAHVQNDPVPPSQRSELEIPGELERLVLQCLAKKPEDRPASALDLDRALADAALDAAWTAQRADAWWSRHRPRKQDLPGPLAPAGEIAT